MSDIALQTSGLGVKYGNFHALAEVDLQIRRNSVHSIIGPNGAGKTTLFHALTGRVRASSGRIELDGRDITGTSDDDRAEARQRWRHYADRGYAIQRHDLAAQAPA